MSTQSPEGGPEANPGPQLCHLSVEEMVYESQDSSLESTCERHGVPERVQVGEEGRGDACEDEQGDLSPDDVDDDMLANGRERLKRHRREVAGRVWIPEIWGQEELLKDWVDCTVFDSSLVPSKIMSAKAALVGEGRRASSSVLRIENRC